MQRYELRCWRAGWDSDPLPSPVPGAAHPDVLPAREGGSPAALPPEEPIKLFGEGGIEPPFCSANHKKNTTRLPKEEEKPWPPVWLSEWHKQSLQILFIRHKD